MYPLLLVSILFASANSTLLHRANLGGRGAIYRYNLICSAVWCVCLLAANGFTLHLSGDVLLWGAIYGVTQTLFVLFKTAAMNSGPVSVTTLIGNCSLLVSVFVCFALWGEPITPADGLGLLILLLGITLSTYKKSEGKMTLRWRILSLLFLVTAAGVGIVFKAFSKSADPTAAGDMMLTSAIVMLVLYTLISLILGGVMPTAADGGGRFALLAALCGVMSCAYNRLNIYLSGVLDGIVFFPLFNGGVVILSALLAVLLLGERPCLRQWLGILTGTVGITIIGIL